jgi:rhomboid family GlyGly-CTERM serine protease
VNRGARGWAALAVALALGTVAVTLWGWRDALDWQPARAIAEPWRAWTAAGVHLSAMHLAANLAGALLVGALGVVADVPRRSTAAWFVAWPLTQFGLLARADLGHYGGLSGVLHAGVAVAAVHLIADGPRARRRIGAAVLVGLVAKVLSEAPWGPAVVHPAGWDIGVAPFAHASGTLAGLACALIAWALAARTSTA